MDSVRAKFKVESITLRKSSRIRDGYEWDATAGTRGLYRRPDGTHVEGTQPMNEVYEDCAQPTVKLVAQSDDGLPENRRYHSATPSGSVELTITNWAAAEFFELGHAYYLDFTPADAA